MSTRLDSGRTGGARGRFGYRPRRDEAGATAVIVAIMAAMLFSLAGLAVDLGNAWARGRASQESSDVSALAAGHLLPATGANRATIADYVATKLNENKPIGQPVVTGTALLDGQAGDGEITFAKADGGACTEGCPRMTVTPPRATVEFGFAAVMGQGSTTVQRSATVEVQSELPRKDDMLPFWLPSGCGYGPTQADTTQGGPSGGPAAPAAYVMPRAAAVRELASAAVVAAAPTPTPLGTHTIGGNAVNSVTAGATTTLSGYSVSGVGAQYKKVSLRAFRPDGQSFIDFSAQTTGDGALPSMQVGPGDVTGTVGDWYVFALAAKQNEDIEYSSNHLVIRVSGTAPTPTPTPTSTAPTSTAPTSPSPSPTVTGVASGCVGQDRGNFGQLSSPRAGESNEQKAFALNIAEGIDHQLAPYVFPSTVAPTKDCGSGSSVLSGAKLDNQSGPAGNGANCIKGDTGNDGPKTYDGLVAGVNDHKGRLETSRGATTCPSRSDLNVSGTLINNDTLSCFLRNGATLAQIASDTGVNTNMLDPAIKRSPRFVYLPVVFANDRAQKGFQPIQQFVPGFITQETQTSGPVDGPDKINGLGFTGNSFKTLHVFTFNRDALSPDEVSDTTAYDPSVGGAIVRLVG